MQEEKHPSEDEHEKKKKKNNKKSKIEVAELAASIAAKSKKLKK